jgi:DNA-directed RNA polymerase specialized sigma24 family protein
MFTDRDSTPQSQATPDRIAQIADFYSQKATELQRAVTRRLRAPQATIEDACQTAWAILLRRPDIPLDHHGFGWLHRVALTTGYRATRPREQPAGGFLPEPGPGELPEPAALTEDIADRVTNRLDHQAQLQALTSRQRRYLLLQATGLTYREMAALTGDSYRTVERQLTRAREHLQQHGG